MRYETLSVGVLDLEKIQWGKNKTGGYITCQIDETNKILKIRPTVDDTGAINIGDGTTDIDFKWFGGAAADYISFDVGDKSLYLAGGMFLKAGTSGAKLSLTASAPIISTHTTTALTTGNFRASEVNLTMTGAASANSIEAFAAIVTSNVQTGNWCNAILGKVDYSSAGFVTGLAGVVCAELDMPAATIGNGSYCCFEAELNAPTGANGWGTTVPVAFLTGNAWGAGVAEFRDEGYVFNFTGLGSPGSSKIIQANTDQPTHALRCLIDGTEYFLLMTTVDNGSE